MPSASFVTVYFNHTVPFEAFESSETKAKSLGERLIKEYRPEAESQ